MQRHSRIIYQNEMGGNAKSGWLQRSKMGPPKCKVKASICLSGCAFHVFLTDTSLTLPPSELCHFLFVSCFTYLTTFLNYTVYTGRMNYD